MSIVRIVSVFLFVCFIACKPGASNQEVDIVFHNGTVYTVDSLNRVVEAFAVRGGRIVALGTSAEMLSLPHDSAVDLQGAFVYPGFHDPHCHFYGYGIDLQKIWLTGTKSFEDILDTLSLYREKRFMGWVFGRGWDQNDWADSRYPDRASLDSLFPDVPVFLMRIDGHAALVNSVALQRAGITLQSKVSGGEIQRSGNRLTGLLIDNAVDLVKNIIPKPDPRNESESLQAAQRNCFAVGLTSLTDAGLDPDVIDRIDSLQQVGRLQIRINAMLSYSPRNLDLFRKRGALRTERLQVRSVKLYADGALGSRGACLMHDYYDLPGHRGFLLTTPDSIRLAAQQVYDMGFQLNTHCIGDSANSLLLGIYGSVLKGPNNRRWRIEHAQCLASKDFSVFSAYNIIPSVQPVHATSDMYWAEERLGPDRIKTAYAYRTLLEQNGILANGSDFPVEEINPLNGFYAAVVRKDHSGFPEKGFMSEQGISRLDALRAMTIWAAFAGFEEDRRGSLEPGKDADFVVLQDDLMKAPDSMLFRIPVLQTWIAAEPVFIK
ncbi:MAG: amidohydrolase [Bacteroidota bacterium]